MSPIIPGVIASGISGHLTPATGYFSIASVTAPSGNRTTNVTFSDIPQTYKHLELRLYIRGAWSSGGNEVENTNIYFNGDTSANYAGMQMYGSNTGSVGASGMGSSSYVAPNASNLLNFCGAAAPAGYFSAGIININDYTNTNKLKVASAISGANNKTGTSDNGFILYRSMYRNSTEAITSITIPITSGTYFAQYSRFALYGIM